MCLLPAINVCHFTICSHTISPTLTLKCNRKVSALLFGSRDVSWIPPGFVPEHLMSLCLSMCTHVVCVTSQCCVCLFLSTHQPGVWRDSLGTDVNKLCLRQSQIQNVCELNCIQPHMSLLVFHPVMFSPRNGGNIHVPLYAVIQIW